MRASLSFAPRLLAAPEAASKAPPTPEAVRQLLQYDPDTGLFWWKERGPEWFTAGAHSVEQECKRWNTRHAGKPAMVSVNRGYCRGRILWKIVEAHRAAWCITYGQWPLVIDHINHNRGDNRLVNLREVTQAENAKNASMYANNKSGATGVFWRPERNQWHASMSSGGKQIHIGVFTTFDDALAARKEAERQHNFHFNHGAAL